MSLMSSQFGPDDMEALFWGPSILTADPFESLQDPDEMMASRPEEPSSPLSSLSSPSSQFSSLSPPSSPSPPLPDDKVGRGLLPLPWVAADQLNHTHLGSGEAKEDAFSGMDWMAETMDLNDFDLDSFISSCDPENSPSSPEELVSSLDSLESLPDPILDVAAVPTLDASTMPDLVPEVQTELEIKTEPPSPIPSPSPEPLPSPAFTLELGSEVDVSEVEKPAPVETPQVSRIVLSLSPTRIVLLLAPPKQEVGIIPTPSCAVALPNSGSGTSLSPKVNSSRTRPYPARPKSSPETVAVSAAPGGSKPRSRVLEKKQRKMEQNKTAATRYRLKKRAEQDVLQTECDQLEERNQELAEKCNSITKEIQYLKELMEEVRLAKQRKVLA
ncbi:activating transcription factor 4b [Sardina pilchardus]|uniref:activating transcription factor 4b n=1 Tax=Sardina pilchardus TaxID=27697 RepID=UPI002E128680